jgi:Ni/Fe-hydrogenase subunit HybB-like protein
MILFYYSYTRISVPVAKIAAVITMLGIIVNRLNVTVIGFRWDEAIRYVPTWMELVVTLTVIFTEIWIFRWVITRMPVLRESPSWASSRH